VQNFQIFFELLLESADPPFPVALQHLDGIASEVGAVRAEQRRDDGDEKSVKVDNFAFVVF
jgi:hypothetical protein